MRSASLLSSCLRFTLWPSVIVLIAAAACQKTTPPASSASAAASADGDSAASSASASDPTPTPAPSAAASTAKVTPCVELDLHGCTAKCDGGEMVSCLRLASMFDKVFVTAVPKDPSRTRAVLEKACAKKFGPACYWLAQLCVEGRGGPKDAARAAALQKTALELEAGECERGLAPACRDLSFAYGAGSGVAKDRVKASALDERATLLDKEACEAGDACSCTSYGIMISDNDAKASVAYSMRGCDGGDPFGCDHLANIYTHGDGVAKDAAKARAFRAKACKGGLTKSCASK